MNEISVIVNQKPGEISWNYEEIKKRLEEELEVYKKTAYTDETIKTAKGDVADLRKLSKAIEDRRKDVKEKCLEPYALIEKQAKELVELIEKPIQAISDQVQDYEKRRKEKARAEINDYWTQKAAELPEDIREKAKTAIYDVRWENATATKKSWREGIESGIQKILDEIGTIRSFASEFEEDMLTVYKVDLSLQKAIAKMNELKAQQERILEIERKKQEAEQKRREEEARQKEQQALKQKQDGAMAGMMQPSAGAVPVSVSGPSTALAGIPGAHGYGGSVSIPQASPQMRQPENTGTMGAPAGNIPHQGESAKMVQPEIQTKTYPGGKSVRLLITGTPEQITKIQNYIRFAGATYQEV